MKHGFERFLFINGHGGNVATVTAAFDEIYAGCLDARAWRSIGRSAARCCSGRRVRERPHLPRELYGEANGSHATAAEVSLAQHYSRKEIKYAPDVAESRAEEHRVLRLCRLSPPLPRRADRLGPYRCPLRNTGRGYMPAAVADMVEVYRAFLAD